MSLSRLPRKFLTSWIAYAIRPTGHPFTSWVTTLVDTLEAKNISTVFVELTEYLSWLIAQDIDGGSIFRMESRMLTRCHCSNLLVLL